jgi:hypothetical protein
MSVFANFLIFQAGWFATVLGAANGAPWLGPVAVLAAVVVHLRTANDAGAELRLLGSAVALGLVADSLLLATGWIAYPNGSWVPGLAPYWIITLWALFATTLNVSMRWMAGRYLLAAVFGAVGGPLSYLAGARLGAMSFVDTGAAVTALAIGWALAMPLLMWLAARFEQRGRTRLPAFIKDSWREAKDNA